MKTTTKKRRLALFVALIMALSLWTALPLQASAATPAQTVTDGDFIYFIPAQADSASLPEAIIIGYKGNASSPTIQGTVNGTGGTYTVNSISAGAFAANSSLQTINIPSTIVSISPYAFYGCTNLISVMIPNEIVYIGNYAFYNCTNLAMTENDLESSVAKGGAYIFGADPSGIVAGSAGDYRYTVTNGEATLWCYTGDSTTPTILPSVTAGGTYPVTGLGAGTFGGRVSLTSLEIPSNVETIGNNAISNCMALTDLTLNEGLENIDDNAFNTCSSLTQIDLPDSLTRIGTSAFRSTPLTQVIIPDNVTTIGNFAFGFILTQGNSSLGSVTIGKNVENFGTQVFQNCSALTDVTISQNVLDAGFNLVFLSAPTANAAINTVTITDATAIPANAFTSKTALTSVTIPDGVISIGNEAFLGCSSLNNVTIPGSVMSIGESAFYNCSSLASLTIENGVMNIGKAAFRDCAGLTTIVIPDSVTDIGERAFSGTSLAGAVVIPDTVTSIGVRAFDGCASLTSVTINGSTDIGEFAFNGCTLLANVTMLSETSTAVAATAFNGTAAGLKIWLYNANDSAKEAGTAGSKVIMIEDMAVTPNPSPLNLSTDGTNGPTGGTLAESFTPSPDYTEQAPTVTWSSSNSGVAMVDPSSGAVTAVGPGTATITATATPLHSGVVLTKDIPVNVSAPYSEPTFPLTVTSGSVVGPSDDGTYPATAQVTITADNVPGQAFVEWTGIAESAFTNGTDKSDSTAVFTMPANAVMITAKYKYATPNAGIDYAAEELTGLIAGETYTFGGVEGVAESGIYAINSSWFDSSISIVKKSDGTVADSDPQSLPIPARPDAPVGISKTDQTTAGQDDGTITGVTTAMQYSSNGGSSWTDVLGTEITGLAPGSYQVRTKATNSDFASAAATLTIAAYEPPAPPSPTTYAVTVTNGSGSSSYEENATVTITANAPATGKVFDTWTTSDGVTFASATSATTTFTMPNHAVAVTATYKDDPNGSGGDDPNPPDGPPATEDNGWVQNEDGEWEYLVDGEAKTGWVYDQSTWYYTNTDGIMQTGWEYVGSSWYYLAGNGEMKTGWVKDKNTWYYLTGSGAMKTGWQKDNGSWYYLGGNGSMVVSKWLKDTSGSWYYLSGNGKMLTGKQTIGAKTYTFKSNGVWVS
jgi:hypothetical protein